MSDCSYRDSSWLYEQYVMAQRPVRDIAAEHDCQESTVRRWLIRYDINLRDEDERKVAGCDTSWTERSRYGPGWNDSKRQAVRERDNKTCQAPGCSMTQDEHVEKFGRRLSVHHLIQPCRFDDPEERNQMENLLTLCCRCHSRWERVAAAGVRPQIIRSDSGEPATAQAAGGSDD